MEIQPGDVLEMKKEHPCGSRRWEVLRVGMDFRLRCTGCGREVMIPGKGGESREENYTLGPSGRVRQEECFMRYEGQIYRPPENGGAICSNVPWDAPTISVPSAGCTRPRSSTSAP